MRFCPAKPPPPAFTGAPPKPPPPPFFFHPNLAVHSPFCIPRLGPQGVASAGLLSRYGSNYTHPSCPRPPNTHARRHAAPVSRPLAPPTCTSHRAPNSSRTPRHPHPA